MDLGPFSYFKMKFLDSKQDPLSQWLPLSLRAHLKALGDVVAAPPPPIEARLGSQHLIDRAHRVKQKQPDPEPHFLLN